MVRRIHATIADHLYALPASDPLRHQETMYHLIKSDQRAKAAQLYVDSYQRSNEHSVSEPASLALADHMTTPDGLQWVLRMVRAPTVDFLDHWPLAERCLFELKEILMDRSRMDVALALAGALAETYEHFLGLAPPGEEQEVLRYLAVSYSAMSGAEEALGNLDEALRHSRRAAEVIERNVAARPGDELNLADRAAAAVRIAQIERKQGSFEGALLSSQRALAVAEEVLAHDGSAISALRNAGNAFCAIGDAYLALQRPEDALANFQSALQVWENARLVKPEDRGWLTDHSSTLSRVGTVQRHLGKHAEALRSFEEAVEMVRPLQRSDPSSYTMRTLSLALGGLTGARHDLNQLDQAESAGVETIAVAGALVDMHEARPEWKRDLIVALSQLGSIRHARGRPTEAMALYQEALPRARALHTLDPERPEWTRTINGLLTRIGDLHSEMGALDAAASAFLETLEGSRLAPIPPTGHSAFDSWRRLSRMGHVEAARQRWPEAFRFYAKALEVMRDLVAKNPLRFDWLGELAGSLTDVASTQIKLSRPDQARAGYEESLAIARRLVARDANDPNAARHLGVALNGLGAALRLEGSPADALPLIRESRTVFERLSPAKDAAVSEDLRPVLENLSA